MRCDAAGTKKGVEMSGKLKSIGVALIAVLALSGVAATSAQATGLFEAEEYPATLESEQTETFEFEIEELGTVECEDVDISGELESAASVIMVTPSFEECSVPGLGEAEVITECDFAIWGGEEVEEGEFETPLDVVCPEELGGAAGIWLHIPTTGCVVSVKGQVGLGGLFIKPKFFPFPDLVVGAKVGSVTAAIENTVGKKCAVGVGAVKLNVYGGLTITAFGIKPTIGLTLK
jgi:hypothetical protein